MTNRRFLKTSLAVLLSFAMIAGSVTVFADTGKGTAEIEETTGSAQLQEVGDVNVDPVEATYKLDKQTYDNGEDITGTLTLKNNNSLPITVSITDTAPAGYELSSKTELARLASGESKEVIFIYKDIDATPVLVVKQKIDVSGEFKEFGNIAGYTTDNKKIATVNKKGLVKFKKTGTVKIGAFIKNGKTKTPVDKTVELTGEKPVPKKKVSLEQGAQIAGINLFDGISKSRPTSWKSSKSSVASVDTSTGLVKSVGGGTAKITAFFGEGKGAAKYSVRVKVPKDSGKSTGSSDAKVSSTEGGDDAIVFSSSSRSFTKTASAKADDKNETFGVSVSYDYDIKGSGSVTASFADTSKGIRDLASDKTDVQALTDTDVLFTVNVLSQEPISDSNPVELINGGSTVKTMNDNGEDGDKTAGDGVFSCTATLNKPKGGQDYTARYNGETTDPITVFFYTLIESSEKEAVINVLNSISSGNINTAEEVETRLKAVPQIENSSVQKSADGKTVEFETTNGVKGVWEKKPDDANSGTATTAKSEINPDELDGNGSIENTSPETPDEETISVQSEQSGEQEAEETTVFSVMSTGSSGSGSGDGKGVLVVRPFRHRGFYYDDFTTAGQKLAGSRGMTVKDDSAADVNLYKKFAEYNTVLIDSHGTKDLNGNTYLLTGEMLKNTDRSYDADFQAGRIVICTGNLLAVGDKWFDKYYDDGSLKNKSLFLGTCFSSANDAKIPKSLIEKGAGAVYGYDNSVSVYYCNSTLNYWTDEVATRGNTAKVAFDNTVSHVGSTDIYSPFARFTLDLNESQNNSKAHIQGKVQSTDGQVLPEAYVTITDRSGTSEVCKVNKDGTFNIAVDPGTYTIKVSAYGYISDTRPDITVTAGEDRIISDAIMLRPVNYTSTSTINGYVDDAATGALLSDVVIRFRKGRDNTTGAYLKYSSGDDVILITDDDGHYSFSGLPTGYYTMEAERAGYAKAYRNIVAGDGITQYFSLSRYLGEGAVRAVLWWDEYPEDLDSHMVGPTPGNTVFHTWYNDEYAYENSRLIADLDRDDTDSYGPETTTVRTKADGLYYFFVHDYSNGYNDLEFDPDGPGRLNGDTDYDGTLNTSGARVQVYIGSELKATYHVPVGQGEGYIYWNVFTYDSRTGALSEVGTLSNVPQTGSTGINRYSIYDDCDGELDSFELSSVEPDLKKIKPFRDGKKSADYLLKTMQEGQGFVIR